MVVNRTELVAKIAAKTGQSKAQTDEVLAALQDVLVDSLQRGETVKVGSMFTVERGERAARTGRNPRTGEEIQIEAGYVAKVRAGSALKSAVK